jgi:hypothetical protein
MIYNKVFRSRSGFCYPPCIPLNVISPEDFITVTYMTLFSVFSRISSTYLLSFLSLITLLICRLVFCYAENKSQRDLQSKVLKLYNQIS